MRQLFAVLSIVGFVACNETIEPDLQPMPDLSGFEVVWLAPDAEVDPAVRAAVAARRIRTEGSGIDVQNLSVAPTTITNFTPTGVGFDVLNPFDRGKVDGVLVGSRFGAVALIWGGACGEFTDPQCWCGMNLGVPKPTDTAGALCEHTPDGDPGADVQIPVGATYHHAVTVTASFMSQAFPATCGNPDGGFAHPFPCYYKGQAWEYQQKGKTRAQKAFDAERVWVNLTAP